MKDDPISEMFGLLNGQMSRKARNAIKDDWTGAELGTMTSDLGLKLDRFKHVINDYMISHHLTLAEPDMTTTETDGKHGHPGEPVSGAHEHEVITPTQLLPLHPGDRVVVLPVNGGQDFVIVARVVPRS